MLIKLLDACVKWLWILTCHKWPVYIVDITLPSIPRPIQENNFAALVQLLAWMEYIEKYNKAFNVKEALDVKNEATK